MWILLLVLAAVFCAFQVMRARRLLLSTIWLAITSAFVAMICYAMGAAEVAVIELSVGAGLVTVLFVFAFSIVGEDTLDELTIVPRPLVWFLILLASFLLGWFVFPLAGSQTSAEQNNFAQVLWEQRSLDALAQIVLIFSGVFGLLGLLADSKRPVSVPLAATRFRLSEKLDAVQPAIIQDSGDGHPEPESITEESLS